LLLWFVWRKLYYFFINENFDMLNLVINLQTNFKNLAQEKTLKEDYLIIIEPAVVVGSNFNRDG